MSSIGMYDGLFDNDDGEGTLPGISICFNLDEQRVVSTENRRCIVTSSWCQSSFSSCCSLCRPPDVSEDGGDDTSLHGLSDSALFSLLPLTRWRAPQPSQHASAANNTRCQGEVKISVGYPSSLFRYPEAVLIQILCPSIIALTTYHQALLSMMHCA